MNTNKLLRVLPVLSLVCSAAFADITVSSKITTVGKCTKLNDFRTTLTLTYQTDKVKTGWDVAVKRNAKTGIDYNVRQLTTIHSETIVNGTSDETISFKDDNGSAFEKCNEFKDKLAEIIRA